MLLHSEFPSTETGASEAQIQAFAERVWQQLKKQRSSLFDKSYWQGRMLDWAMQDPSFKTDLFHFVDVLPCLKTKEQVTSHVREYLLKPGRKLPAGMSAALKVASLDISAAATAHTMRKNVSNLAQRFIAGTDIHDASLMLLRLWYDEHAFSVDLLGEACLSEQEAQNYILRYTQAIDQLAEQTEKWEHTLC